MTDLERFVYAYTECMIWADCGDDSHIPANASLSADAIKDIQADCHSWWRRFGPYVDACVEKFDDQCSFHGTGAENAGHDFYLTRNDHGAGFWDGDWPETYATILTNGAKAYGTLQPYLGDDGQIYVG